MTGIVGRGLAALVLTIPAAAQCALCRSAVETGNPLFAEALRSGILLLLAMPYVLGLCVAFVLWRARRRRQAVSENVSQNLPVLY
ncbi:MAG: hypothetical protein NZ473_07515 [Candidatus Kapabacteria bacterium]|nr:hypothetical protein [Candidatus Kapabacteria bacterium]MDW8224479.1 hypothetical protein [Bacteroidota bacterium]